MTLDLSILDLTALGACKTAALTILSASQRDARQVIEAREWVTAIDRELDRRMAWAEEVRAALAAL